MAQPTNEEAYIIYQGQAAQWESRATVALAGSQRWLCDTSSPAAAAGTRDEKNWVPKHPCPRQTTHLCLRGFEWSLIVKRNYIKVSHAKRCTSAWVPEDIHCFT